jgi:hypothetical protein
VRWMIPVSEDAIEDICFPALPYKRVRHVSARVVISTMSEYISCQAQLQTTIKR